LLRFSTIPISAAFGKRALKFWRQSVLLRYVGTVGMTAGVMSLIAVVGPPGPVGGGIAVGTLIFGAWWGGLGPALLLVPVLFVVSRLLDESKPWLPTSDEMFGMFIMTLIAGALGLAGQYYRRNRATTRKLQQQARALSLAHLIFRDLDGTITEWSEGAERMFGWTNSEAVGQSLPELLRSKFPSPWTTLQDELEQTGQWHGEGTYLRKDGVELQVVTHWILYRDKFNAPLGVAELFNDVSELRRAEASIREADRRKDEFLATLAHELRNPLAPIRTGLELLKLLGDEPAEREEVRATMERQTQQLVRLVDDLLDVSRITRGKLELRKSLVNLSEILRGAVAAARPFIEEARHELKVRLPDAPVLLDADPHRLSQVFSNLLNNAAKYTPPGGRIELSFERTGSEVVVKVRDNGIGIPEEKQEYIFELFSQVGRIMDSGQTGLGIGLTLAKSLVEMHGGSIEVRSDGPSTGSEFRVRLPFEIPTPVSQTLAPLSGETPRGLGERKVLVVDDNLASCHMLSALMRRLGLDVRMAHDGEEAIEVAAQFLPELILMDLGMPRVSGYEAARRIRQEPWGKELMLVAVTGWGQAEDRRRTREAGFDHHLTKPAELTDLKRLLEELKPRLTATEQC